MAVQQRHNKIPVGATCMAANCVGVIAPIESVPLHSVREAPWDTSELSAALVRSTELTKWQENT